VVALPFFITSLIMGALHPAMVTRASPLYCTFNLSALCVPSQAPTKYAC
jgi:hypothetical protein